MRKKQNKKQPDSMKHLAQEPALCRLSGILGDAVSKEEAEASI